MISLFILPPYVWQKSVCSKMFMQTLQLLPTHPWLHCPYCSCLVVFIDTENYLSNRQINIHIRFVWEALQHNAACNKQNITSKKQKTPLWWRWYAYVASVERSQSSHHLAPHFIGSLDCAARNTYNTNPPIGQCQTTIYILNLRIYRLCRIRISD